MVSVFKLSSLNWLWHLNVLLYPAIKLWVFTGRVWKQSTLCLPESIQNSLLWQPNLYSNSTVYIKNLSVKSFFWMRPSKPTNLMVQHRYSSEFNLKTSSFIYLFKPVCLPSLSGSFRTVGLTAKVWANLQFIRKENEMVFSAGMGGERRKNKHTHTQ